MHFYQFHIGDYKSHTHHLSPIEDLAFRRLLDHYYLHEEAIKQRDIARKIGLQEYEQEVLTVLDEFFVSTEIGYIHPRADAEIEKYRKFAEDGKKGAAKRWSKPPHSPPISPPNATPIATNNQEPRTNNHIKDKQRGSRLAQDFELTEEWVKFCRQERPELIPHKVFSSFKDYWIAQPGQKGVKLDWFATWRNWVRNVKHERPTFAQQAADVARTTVEATNKGPDPALLKIVADREKAVAPSDFIREQMEKIKRSAGR